MTKEILYIILITPLPITVLSKERCLMSIPDKTIDSRILESAREEFLTKPYQEVSLRDICKKAGVTTGALYKRYENKEALFDALVEPTLVLIEEYSNQTETFNYNQLEKKDMETVWKNTSHTQNKFIDMIYDNKEGFLLLLCHSDGTKYHNFLHDFVNMVSSASMKFMNTMCKNGELEEVIDADEMHMLLTAYWSTMFEPVIHGLSREQALRHSLMVAKLFDWSAVLSF